METLLITKGASGLVLSLRAVAGEIRESVGGVLDVRLRECASSGHGPFWIVIWLILPVIYACFKD
jgi:hypothetical protein